MRNGAHRLVRFAGRKRKLTMFALQKFESKDVPSCAVCFYESFFDCPLSENDVRFLRDYAQVLIEIRRARRSKSSLTGFSLKPKNVQRTHRLPATAN